MTNVFSLIQQIHQTMDNSDESGNPQIYSWIYSCRIGSSDPIGRVECGYNRKGELQQTFVFPSFDVKLVLQSVSLLSG